MLYALLNAPPDHYTDEQSDVWYNNCGKLVFEEFDCELKAFQRKKELEQEGVVDLFIVEEPIDESV